jgi:DNA repair exonuclease SbcCD ATPase subunit
MPKPKSRTARWQEAVSDARAAYESLEQALNDLNEVREEYANWRDNLPENLQQSSLGEKLDQVSDIETDAYTLLTDVESAISEAEGADLPLGFGRD